MDPGFFVDPNPDFKNPDPDTLFYKPYNSWSAASVQTQSKAFVTIVHCSHLTFQVVEADAGQKRLGSPILVSGQWSPVLRSRSKRAAQTPEPEPQKGGRLRNTAGHLTCDWPPDLGLVT